MSPLGDAMAESSEGFGRGSQTSYIPVHTQDDTMKSHFLFFIFAAATVACPGPGVLLTLSNALRTGLFNTFAGILGVACGAMAVAGISATSLGVILSTSALAFTMIKYVGSAYLIYLGIKLFHARPVQMQLNGDAKVSGNDQRTNKLLRHFVQGISLQLTNPKVVFFFMSIFPQFIDSNKNYFHQFSMLVVIYGGLVAVIHTVYALAAKKAGNWITSPRGGNVVSKTGGSAFIFFGIMLARSNH
jgi:threonine/homoserine/homoserine lactone efflux protein